MGNVPQSFLQQLVQSGALTTSLAVQEAAAEQVNNATNNSTDETTANQSWGKSIPVLIGHTRTVALPLWTGKPVADVDNNADETDSISFAVLIGRPGPQYDQANLLRIWFDNVLVWDATDPSEYTQLTGEQLKLAFYDGHQTQQDPTIAASETAVPAYTGSMYVVFSDVITRKINATTTTTVFSKLPEVQCEVMQSAINAANGATYTAFGGVPAVRHGYRTNFYSYLTHLYYAVNDVGFEIYNVLTNTLVGSVIAPIIQAHPGEMSCYDFQLNVIAKAANGLTIVDAVTGATLASCDAQAIDVCALGFGYFVTTVVVSDLYFFDGTQVQRKLSNFVNPHFNGGGLCADRPLNTNDVPTQTAKMCYAVCETDTLWRIVMEGGTYGIVSNDGSGSTSAVKQGAYPIYRLSGGDVFAAVMCLPDDGRFVYAIVNETQTGKSSLRKYGTFCYVNPQNNAAPPLGKQSVFNNPHFIIEISRTELPRANNGSLPGAAMYRDRRHNVVAYPTGFGGLNVVDFAQASYQSYNIDQWYYNNDTENKYTGLPYNLIWLPGSDRLLTYGNADFVPGWVRPRAVTEPDAPYSLAAIFDALALLADYDLGNVQCIGMDDTVKGMQLNTQVSFAELAAQLCAVFRVDLIEQADGSLLFQRRLNVADPDYLLQAPQFLPTGSNSNPSNTVGIERVASNELPAVLQLSFINEDYGFVVGAATVKRVTYPQATVFGKSFLGLSIPIVMGGTDAVYFAGIALFDMWAGKTNFSINLPPYFMFVTVGDFVELLRPSGRADLCKVVEVAIGADKTLSVTLSSVGSLKPLPSFQGADGSDQTLPSVPPKPYGTFTTPTPSGVYNTVIDNVPLLTTDAAGTDLPLYVVSSAPADIWLQFGSDQPIKVGTTAASPFGILQSELDDTYFPHQTDTLETITILLASGAVLGVTEDVFRAGGSAVAIGVPGRWELIWFRDVAVNGAAVTLSRLLRGRLGTETMTGLHEVGDIAVFVPAGILRASAPLSQLGQSGKFFAMPPGAQPSSIGGTFDTLVLRGGTLVPRQPLEPKAVRQSNDDIKFTWYRQDRSQPDTFWNDPPQSEALEQYVLTLPTMSVGQVSSRQVYAGTNSYVYSATDQAADGNSLKQVYAVTIAQVSQIVGTGNTWKGKLNVE